MKSIILSGGSGTRLWPLSREYYPKQYVHFIPGEYSLFQKTFDRCLRLADGNVSDIFIVSNDHQKFLIMGQLEELGINFPSENILIEPAPKNTLPAITFGIREILGKIRRSGGADQDETVAVFPSDHVIAKEDTFLETISNAAPAAAGHLVTFGIVPSKPHTGYGYISPGLPVEDCAGVFNVRAFHEKPSLENAVKFLSSGYLWNGGIFLFNASVFVEELKEYAPEVYDAFFSASDDKFSPEEAYETVPNISIDYGVIEKSEKVAVAGLDAGWNDLGSFDSFYDEFGNLADADKNVVVGGELMPIDSKGNLVCARDKLVSLIGVSDLIVVDTDDSLLIATRENSQNVKNVVKKLKEQNNPKAEFHTHVYRPWGSYRILNEADTYKIKELIVLPGKKLSSQLHHHRSEHWAVVMGTARVTLNGKVSDLARGESTYIPKETVHRLENPGPGILKIIESQIGDYCGEDDIVRFDDDWGRK